MARYLQIETRIPYHNKIMQFGNIIGDLPVNGARGYDHFELSSCVDILSRAILSVIAIYARRADEPTGKDVICRLLETQEVVRHFMRQDQSRELHLVPISDGLLYLLGLEMAGISSGYQPGYAWMNQLTTMVVQLRYWGNRIN
jgi:hypothetical protein